MARTFLLAMFQVFALVACGPPKAGDACGKAGFVCLDATSALECRDKFWVQLPCRGAGGCALTNGVVTCDMVGNVVGDLCASSAEGSGLCAPDGKAILVCRQGALVQTEVCTSCVLKSNDVTCTQ